jgi:hypothetical protein
LKGKNDKRVIAHKSRWYGVKEVVNLVWKHELENDFEYDLVVNARFDICWNKKYDFSNLNPNNFHHPSHLDRPTWGYPDENPEISDHIFVTNSNWIKHFATLYDKIDEYTLPGQCPQWNTISNHFLMVWHLSKLGLLSPDILRKSFNVWYNQNTDAVGGSTNPNINYDIFRYRNLTEKDLYEYFEKN